MRVKIFEEVIQVGQRGAALQAIELKINDWLDENPRAEIVDIRLAMGGAPVERGPTNFAALCLILYKDEAA